MKIGRIQSGALNVVLCFELHLSLLTENNFDVQSPFWPKLLWPIKGNILIELGRRLKTDRTLIEAMTFLAYSEGLILETIMIFYDRTFFQ